MTASATTTATAAAATTAAAAATTTAAAAAAASRALFGFVDTQRASVEIGAIHGRHRAFGLRTRAHGHEAEATRLASHSICHQMNVDDLTVSGERVAQHVLR